MKNGEVKIGDVMVYAIIENGGKQYKAVEGELIEVDLMSDDLGIKKVLDKVLLVVNDSNTLVGSPFIKEASIETTVVEHFKGDKIVIFKYRPKERYRVKTGHRQKYTRLIVDSIKFPGKSEDVKVLEEGKTPSKRVRTKPAGTVKKAVAKAGTKSKAEVTKPVKKASKKTITSKTEKKN